MNAQRALLLAKEAIAAIDAELALHEIGMGSIGFPKQLQALKDDFRKIVFEIEAGRVTGRRFGIGRTVVDSWPHATQLGDLLIGAEEAYLKLSR